MQEAIIRGLQLYLSNAVLQSAIDTRDITSLFVSGGCKIYVKNINDKSIELKLVSYFLSPLAEHTASFQRFLGLEVCIP
jgi:hypothetical protein